MLSDHQVMKLRTAQGQELQVEVNYSKNKKVENCQMVKFHFDGKEFEVKQSDLVAMMMVIGSVENQKKMLPMKMTRIRKMERLLTFEFNAKKAYEKGEVIRIQAPWIDTVPETEEVFAGVVSGKKKSHFSQFTK